MSSKNTPRHPALLHMVGVVREEQLDRRPVGPCLGSHSWTVSQVFSMQLESEVPFH